MLYQKLLMGETPYHLSFDHHMEGTGFQEHRHPEAEFIYCVSGSFDAIIEKKPHKILEGQLLLIAPMEAHRVEYSGKAISTLLIEVGPSLLRTNFAAFSDGRFSSCVKTLEKSDPLREILSETVSLTKEKNDFSELLITGNVYKICGHVLSKFVEGTNPATKDMKAVENIEKALELIQNRYADPITVDMAAEATGYGKSNFCKIFKKITGQTFHCALNRQRIENACVYLDETTMPISKIAAAVGFPEIKCFCRVFKQITGITPGERRKK